MDISETGKACQLLIATDTKHEHEITVIETINTNLTLNFINSTLYQMLNKNLITIIVWT